MPHGDSPGAYDCIPWSFILDSLRSRPTTLLKYGWDFFRRKAIIANLTRSLPSQVQFCYNRISSNKELESHLKKELRDAPYYGENFYTGFELYVICSLLKPQIIVETGVAAGYSTTFFLQALHDLGRGHLYSIDASKYALIQETKREGSTQTRPNGWLIPDWLRDRWTLKIGLTSEVLEPLLRTLGSLELFYHDSLHTYENMTFELETALKYTPANGLILADNIDWNTSFFDFCKNHNLAGRHVHANLGATRVRKPDSKAPSSYI